MTAPVPTKKSLKEYSNEDLIELINHADEVGMSRLGAICAEILRRMNEKKSLFDERYRPVNKPLRVKL